MYHNFCIHSSVDGYLGCFHVRGILSSVVVNTGVHVSLSVIVFSVYTFSSGIVGSYSSSRASQMVLVVKNLSANAGGVRDVGLIPGSGRFPGGGHGNPLSIHAWRTDRGHWWATVHRVAKSWT